MCGHSAKVLHAQYCRWHGCTSPRQGTKDLWVAMDSEALGSRILQDLSEHQSDVEVTQVLSICTPAMYQRSKGQQRETAHSSKEGTQNSQLQLTRTHRERDPSTWLQAASPEVGSGWLGTRPMLRL